MPGATYSPARNSELGGPETMDDPTASTDLIPGSPPSRLTTRGAY